MAVVTRNGTVDKKWWKSAVVYQIYPASFCDSNGDGIGDLPGIISKLDHIKSLGANVVWLSPIFKSPQVDMGYDISDYKDVHPPYGTVADVDTLIAELHKRDMKLMLDLVVNHTSDQHPWFLDSRSSKTAPKRDWFIWRPPRFDKDGKRKPPNNWRAAFGGSVWEWDEVTEEYFYHYFCPEQPDLNFEVDEVREAVYDLMRFWMDKGCDGYRMDVIGLISKITAFPDAEITNPLSEYQTSANLTGPRLHEYLQEMNREVMSRYDSMTVGELARVNVQQMREFVHPDRHELQMGFAFDHVNLGQEAGCRILLQPWRLSELKRILTSWQVGLEQAGGWHALYLENHDQPRSISRYANDHPTWREASGKLLAMMHATMWGTVYIYQGQEIGMVNLPKEWPLDEWKDVQTQNYVREFGEQGKDVPTLTKRAFDKARDNARSPMQWNKAKNAGFSTGEPWMRVHDNYVDINVEEQVGDGGSVLSFWKDMLALRVKHEDVLVYGTVEDLCPEDERLYVYTRMTGDAQVLVILNFTDQEVEYPVTADKAGKMELLKATEDVSGDEGGVKQGKVTLAPYSGRVYAMH